MTNEKTISKAQNYEALKQFSAFLKQNGSGFELFFEALGISQEQLGKISTPGSIAAKWEEYSGGHATSVEGLLHDRIVTINGVDQKIEGSEQAVINDVNKFLNENKLDPKVPVDVLVRRAIDNAHSVNRDATWSDISKNIQKNLVNGEEHHLSYGGVKRPEGLTLGEPIGKPFNLVGEDKPLTTNITAYTMGPHHEMDLVKDGMHSADLAKIMHINISDPDQTKGFTLRPVYDENHKVKAFWLSKGDEGDPAKGIKNTERGVLVDVNSVDVTKIPKDMIMAMNAGPKPDQVLKSQPQNDPTLTQQQPSTTWAAIPGSVPGMTMGM